MHAIQQFFKPQKVCYFSAWLAEVWCLGDGSDSDPPVVMRLSKAEHESGRRILSSGPISSLLQLTFPSSSYFCRLQLLLCSSAVNIQYTVQTGTELWDNNCYNLILEDSRQVTFRSQYLISEDGCSGCDWHQHPQTWLQARLQEHRCPRPGRHSWAAGEGSRWTPLQGPLEHTGKGRVTI